MKIFVRKPLGFMKLSHSSEMQNDALMHREGIKGWWIFKRYFLSTSLQEMITIFSKLNREELSGIFFSSGCSVKL